MAKPKAGKLPNGRPPLSALNDLQRYTKRKILLNMEPHVKGVIDKLVELTGVQVSSEQETTEVFDKKSAKLPPNIQHSACKTFLDMYLNTTKVVYGNVKDGKSSLNDDGDDNDEDSDNRPKELSLVVPIRG